MVAIRTEQVAYRYCVPRGTRYTTRMESINTTEEVMKLKQPMDAEDVTVCNYILDLRGRLIVSQALTIAVNELSKVEGAHRQVGNISDMQYILDSNYAIDLSD